MNGFPPSRRAPSRSAPSPGGDSLADTRIRFLTSESVTPAEVREPILASWWRSKRFQVPADRIELPYVEDQDLHTPLIRSADPVLDRLGDQLEGQPISLILTDPTGVVLAQRTGDPALHRHLQSVELAPGFSYGERFVGTNGIGTALEHGGPMHVFGHEHYAEHLEDLACAGAPIYHPVTGRMIGLLDLTCWRKDAGGLLIALARTTAEQIRQAVLSTSSSSELELFQAYLQTCRRTIGIVMALNDDVVMMNDAARKQLDPRDQTALLRRASEALASGRTGWIGVELPTGNAAQMRCARVGDAESSDVGGVLHVRLVEIDDEARSSRPGWRSPTPVPGLVGSAPLWLRCCQEVDASLGEGEWIVLTGEAGVGKYAIARSVQRRQHPTEHLRMLDAAPDISTDAISETRRELIANETDSVVIRHADRLDGEAAKQLTAMLTEVRTRRRTNPPWIALTAGSDVETHPELNDLLALFARTVQVPPLRLHIEDLPELTSHFLSRLSHGAELTCSQATMRLFLRSTWPGNATELEAVLKHVTQHRRRTGVIQPNDVPAEFHAVTRHALTQLESIERDAIVASLKDAHGSKARAAKLLGISRATIYRKIHQYGIVPPYSDR